MLKSFGHASGGSSLLVASVLLFSTNALSVEPSPPRMPQPEPITFSFDLFPQFGHSPFACLFPLVWGQPFDVLIFGEYSPAWAERETGVPDIRFLFRLPLQEGSKASGTVGIHWFKDEKEDACQLKGSLPSGNSCIQALLEAGCIVEMIDVDEDRWPGLERFLWELTEIPIRAQPRLVLEGETATLVVADRGSNPLLFFSATPEGALRKWLVKLHRWALAHSARKGPLESPINLHVVVP